MGTHTRALLEGMFWGAVTGALFVWWLVLATA